MGHKALVKKDHNECERKGGRAKIERERERERETE